MNKKKSFITSTLVTLLVVVMLILSGPVQAVSVVISGVQPSYTQGKSVDFQVQITINDPDRYVPLSNISLDVTGTDSINRTFALDGSPISGNPIINITPVSVPQPGDFGYGYGYGYDSQNGYGYNFGNGSGYGYGYGGGGGEVTYIYNVSINTTSLPTGNYMAIASLNTGKAIKPSFKSAPVNFEITTDNTPPVARPGGGGAGTGGGGVVTSEPFDNIAKSETYEKSLIANTSVTYRFKAPEHGIYEIAVTGKENENDIALRVEALKDTSRLVKEPAPGVVYRNVNVWSGTKRIKEVLIRFKVENSWLSSNSLAGSEVRMVQWREKTWVHLDTLEKNRDDKFTYYEAKTNTLSVFAITGLKGVATAVESYPQVTETSLPAETAETPTEKVPGFGIVLAMVTISALYMLRKGKK